MVVQFEVYMFNFDEEQGDLDEVKNSNDRTIYGFNFWVNNSFTGG